MQYYNHIYSIDEISDSSGAPTEPVTAAEVKHYLRLEGFEGIESDSTPFDEDDELIEDMIIAAREGLEKMLGVVLVPKKLRVTLTNLAGNIPLPGPITDKDTVKVYDSSEDEVTDFKLIGDKWLRLNYPEQEYLTLEYEAGYNPVPKALRQAILIEVAYRWTNRGDNMEDTGICRAAMVKAAPFNRTAWLT